MLSNHDDKLAFLLEVVACNPHILHVVYHHKILK